MGCPGCIPFVNTQLEKSTEDKSMFSKNFFEHGQEKNDKYLLKTILHPSFAAQLFLSVLVLAVCSAEVIFHLVPLWFERSFTTY